MSTQVKGGSGRASGSHRWLAVTSVPKLESWRRTNFDSTRIAEAAQIARSAFPRIVVPWLRYLRTLSSLMPAEPGWLVPGQR